MKTAVVSWSAKFLSRFPQIVAANVLVACIAGTASAQRTYYIDESTDFTGNG